MGDARERVGDPEQKLDDAEQDDCPLCLHRDRRDEEEDHPIGEQHAESEEDAEDAARRPDCQRDRVFHHAGAELEDGCADHADQVVQPTLRAPAHRTYLCAVI